MERSTQLPAEEATENEIPTETRTEAGQPQEVLTADEVAELLRVNRKTVYTAFKKREIPGGRKIGGTIRFHRAAVLGWLAGQDRVSLPAKGGAR